MLEKIVKTTVNATKINLWRSTTEVIDWFKSISNKQNASFICFDIVDFYPSISEQLLNKALDFAGQFHPISDQERQIIMHTKKTLLFSGERPWIKKGQNEKLFDVTMGSFDGAEACELVVCFLLNQLNKELGQASSIGLYRDDGLAVCQGTARQVENTKKRVCKIFERNDLRVTIEANKKITDHLDITLDLNTGTYKPYMKPGNVPLYVHTKSNHPPNVIKAIPEGINKRLSEISSSEEIFNQAAPAYQTALEKSGYKYKLKYQPRSDKENVRSSNRRKRARNITWFNPPFDLRVKTNIGREFLRIVDDSFPIGHKLKPIFNRNTLKLSYSCMPNVKSSIDSHNKSCLNKDRNDEPKKKPCNCRDKQKCPLDGECRENGIVYQATVITKNNQKTYVGLTDTEFKQRYSNHKQSFVNPKLRNTTELSKYVWELKDQNIEFNIKWTILGRSKSYSNLTKRCNLCTLEKYYIICHGDKATLNKKSELVSCCRHSSKFLLKNYK